MQYEFSIKGYIFKSKWKKMAQVFHAQDSRNNQVSILQSHCFKNH